MMASESWRHISASCLADETELVESLRHELDHHPARMQRVSALAASWISAIRGVPLQGYDALLQQFRLGSAEGLALMSLAEALLRIPDREIADQLIEDVLAPINWEQQPASDSRLVNMATRGLTLARRWLASPPADGVEPAGRPPGWWRQAAATVGHPVLRQVLRRGVRELAEHYVFATDISAGLRRARSEWGQRRAHSFDILGEAALTRSQSDRYYHDYRAAIEQLAKASGQLTGHARPGLSLKLSALHPRYQPQHWPLLQQELLPRLVELVRHAASADITLTIDAEEADRFELGLLIIERCYHALAPGERDHLGLALQSYGKRARPALAWLRELAGHYQMRIPLRLVKGAYWDTEIKRAQQHGLDDYPVFTCKPATDISYLACARWLLAHRKEFYPQFATHNAVTIAAILEEVGSETEPAFDFEFQRLYGMGEPLYREVLRYCPELAVRVYAPVGAHQELLPYLVRRLLENGANSSFVNQVHDPAIPIDELAMHPLMQVADETQTPPPPRAIFLPERTTSRAPFLATEQQRQAFLHALNAFRGDIHTHADSGAGVTVTSPYDGLPVGDWEPMPAAAAQKLLTTAASAQPGWAAQSVNHRADCLDRMAALLDEQQAELVVIMAREAGKTLENALHDVREAADFCRYYAIQARRLMTSAAPLPGPTGEENTLSLAPRGTFICISPWNFPAAIFTGQVAAALVTGNAVIAKPAEQATLTAFAVARLFHRAGIPQSVFQLAPGAGEEIGAALCRADGIGGIAFTGGWETARAINFGLAERRGALVPFIAETGGLNALIADSSAYAPQLVADMLRSAFDSAGQRCSALRLAFLPIATAEDIEQLLCEAMQELRLGDPLEWATDIGPVIDAASRQALDEYIDRWRREGRVLCQVAAPTRGQFVAPAVIRLQRPTELTREYFGPVLHVVRYRHIDEAVEWVNSCGFGLTCGIHSRNEAMARRLADRLQVGNCYINRDMIGAVVGSQPFGGAGKSGTGFKAGGPHYLLRFLQERTVTLNTAAWGGDQRLLSRMHAHP